MLKEFLGYANQHGLFNGADRILLAVSGGLDSVVMAHLFRDAGMNCALAHCNYKLRGSESDADEHFVRHLASELGFRVFVASFNTKAFADQHRLSVQVAARQLRYDFFNEVAESEGFSRIAVAHHKDDQVETVMMNLGRGSGIRGMKGMPRQSGRIIRPLLFSTREEILVYALSQGYQWREDSSNNENYYLRNRIRNEALPLLNELMPGFSANVYGTANHLAEAGILLEYLLRPWRERLVVNEDGVARLLLDDLPDDSELRSALVKELLKPFGFTASEALTALGQEQGGHVAGRHYVAETAEDGIYLIPVGPERMIDEVSDVASGWEGTLDDYGLKFSYLNWNEGQKPDQDRRFAFLDAGKLRFPLKVRSWRRGDRMNPLGMEGSKLISDLFVDLKVPVHARNRTAIVESGDGICWVAGYRISEQHKVDQHTRRVLCIELTKTR